MSDAGKNPLALRVLNGAARGAEVELRHGVNYTIGIDDEADLIIDDAGIAGRHAEIELSGNTVRVRPLAPAEVLLEGQSFEGGVVPLYTAVVLGSTAVAFGELGETWPRVEVPFDSRGSEDRILEAPLEAEEEKLASADAGRRAGGGRWLWLSMGTIAVLLVIVPSGLGLYEMLQLHRTASEALAREEDPVVETGRLLRQVLNPDDPSTRARDWIDAWTRLKVDRRGQAWTVSGYLKDKAQVNAVIAACTTKLKESKQQSSLITWEIRQESVLERSLNDILARFSIQAKSVYLGDGRFAIDGTYPSSQDWSKEWSHLATTVQQEIPSIRSLLDRMTAEAPPAGTTDSAPSSAIASTEHSPPIPLAIRSISLGRSNCVTLVSGERLFEGAELPSGHRLESIEPGRLIVSQGSQRLQLIINPSLITPSTKPAN